MIHLEPDFGTMSLLKFKDFVPEQLDKNIWTQRGTYESLGEMVGAINQWMLKHTDYDLINIETVVLPNIHTRQEEGSQDPEILIGAGSGMFFHQFFRVWYIDRSAG